jgi:hypothetical protein
VWISGSILTLVVVLVLIRFGYAYRATGFGQYEVNDEVQPFNSGLHRYWPACRST